MTRRTFIAASTAAAAQSPPSVRRDLFLPSPGPGIAVLAQAYYTASTGGAMLSIEHRMSRSDTVDVAYYRTSADHGATWTPPVQQLTGERRPEGMWRRHPRGGFVDRISGLFIEFWLEGTLPHDDPLEGMRQWNVFYRAGAASEPHQIIQAGRGFDARHPLPGIYTGKNMVMLGDVASVPINAGKEILLPTVVTPLAPDGKLYNPTGGYTYTDALVLHASWKHGQLSWRASDPVKGDPARCTRGMDEPTLEQLRHGRLIMLLRGSNDRNHALPAYRWVSYSTDGGWRWTAPAPWTFHDGTPFFSPSTCSQLLRHSNGRLYWIGHISPDNPRGNRPRYPLYLGRVDDNSGLLLRDTLVKLDDRQPGDDETLMIYNIYAREDRRTHEVAIHASRITTPGGVFAGDAMLYHVRV
ncbi:MAG TPA: sialidase family protein [Bryobacteraceae bacterium]|jgi:hypothetical protein